MAEVKTRELMFEEGAAWGKPNENLTDSLADVARGMG
jgi:hypothetical protein